MWKKRRERKCECSWAEACSKGNPKHLENDEKVYMVRDGKREGQEMILGNGLDILGKFSNTKIGYFLLNGKIFPFGILLRMSDEEYDLIGKVNGNNVGNEKYRRPIQVGLVLLLACR